MSFNTMNNEKEKILLTVDSLIEQLIIEDDKKYSDDINFIIDKSYLALYSIKEALPILDKKRLSNVYNMFEEVMEDMETIKNLKLEFK